MVQQIGFGALVGLIVGLLSWRGNQSAGLVSTFPDLFTFVALAVLLAVAIYLVPQRRAASLHSALTVAIAAGVVFGAAVVGIGFARFANPAPPLLLFGFFTAFGSALLCGVAATLLPATIRHERAS